MAETVSVRLLDTLRIGLGPSSRHTVGPMRAAGAFRESLLAAGVVPSRVEVILKGSLSSTGRGHGTDLAVLGGLLGWEPETCDPDLLRALPSRLEADPRIPWGGGALTLRPSDIQFLPYHAYRGEELPHPNTMVCRAHLPAGEVREEVWCSVGGGFIRRAEEIDAAPPAPTHSAGLHPFHNAATLLAVAESLGCTLGEVVLRNEATASTRRRPGGRARRVEHLEGLLTGPRRRRWCACLPTPATGWHAPPRLRPTTSKSCATTPTSSE